MVLEENTLATNLATIELITKISEAIYKNDYKLGVFLDLAKAFDTVNHENLLRKLDHNLWNKGYCK